MNSCSSSVSVLIKRILKRIILAQHYISAAEISESVSKLRSEETVRLMPWPFQADFQRIPCSALCQLKVCTEYESMVFGASLFVNILVNLMTELRI